MREAYLDSAAATPLDPRVRYVMEPYFSDEFGNPSSIHEKGRRAREAVEQARRTIARILHCRPDEIIFTSGATEADNAAILGVARAAGKGHVITTTIEHDAILKAFRALEQEGFAATYPEVSSEGLADPADIEKVVRPDTILISIGYANSEIGVVQPLPEIGKSIGRLSNKAIFHSDASQAAGFLDMDVQKLGVDLMTLNSGKIYGPKGVGCLFVRHGIELQPIIYGGGQERGLRSGTENVPGIVGFAKALEIAEDERLHESGRLVGLRDSMIGRILKEIPQAILNGHPTKRLPNNVNVSIPGLDGETLVIYLSQRGVYASTGSACTALSLAPSHVIAALGKQEEYTRGSLRFTLGRATTKDDIDYAVDSLKDVVKTLKRNG